MKIPFLNIEIRKSAPERVTRSLLWPWQFGRGLSPNSNYDALLRSYLGWVYTASSKNATAVASTPIRLYVGKPNRDRIKSHPTRPISADMDLYIREKNPTLSSLPQVKKAVEIEEVIDHPMLDLFRTVNAFTNQFSMFELTDLFQELCGNSYWYILKDKLGIPREIWMLPPANVKVIPDRTRFIKGYEITQGFEKIFFDESEIVHFKMPSPTSFFYGRSPLSAVTSSFNISQSINAYELAVFQNMGRLEGAFETDNELSQYEFDRLKEEIKQTFRGIENVGKSPLLEKGVKYKTYGASPRDLSFINGRSKVKEEILNAYGQSLGLWDKDSTRANAMVANETFMRDAIRPRLIRTEEKINEKLTPSFDDKLFVAFEDPVPEDKEFRLKERESNLKTGYSSVNIERQEDNRGPVAWGDVPLLPANMAPLGEGQEVNSREEEVSNLLEEGIGEYADGILSKVMERLRGEQRISAP